MYRIVSESFTDATIKCAVCVQLENKHSTLSIILCCTFQDTLAVLDRQSSGDNQEGRRNLGLQICKTQSLLGILHCDDAEATCDCAHYNKASEYFRAAISLAGKEGLGQNLLECDWYKTAWRKHQEIQNFSIAHEVDFDVNVKGPLYPKEIQLQLNDLDDFQTLKSFVDHVLRLHPPRGMTKPDILVLHQEFLSLPKENLYEIREKVLELVNKLLVCYQYHDIPGEQAKADIKWKILCSEITKHINRLYQSDVMGIE